MGSETGSFFSEVTKIVDRSGRRIRMYHRKRSDRPGVAERREKRAAGLRWCNRCRDWLPCAELDKNSLCRAHAREAYREFYRANRDRLCAAKVARKRAVAPVDHAEAALLLDQCGGACVYCGKAFESWDHVDPVSNGGITCRGNIVPACGSCNSAKGNRGLVTFLSKRPSADVAKIVDLLVMEFV